MAIRGAPVLVLAWLRVSLLLLLLLLSALGVLQAQAPTLAGIWTDETQVQLQQGLQSSAVLLLDPSATSGTASSCPDCDKLDHFWNMAASYYGTHRVFRGWCSSAASEKWCQERGYGLAGVVQPLLLAWSRSTQTWRMYDGPKDLPTLKQWMEDMLFNLEGYGDAELQSIQQLSGANGFGGGPSTATLDHHPQMSFAEYQRTLGIDSTQAPAHNQHVDPYNNYNNAFSSRYSNGNNDGDMPPTWWPSDPTLLAALRMTPLHAAALGGDIAMVREIIKDLNTVMLQQDDRTKFQQRLHARKAIINLRNRNGATALNLAAQAGHAPLVRILVKEYHADMTIADAQGATPLRAAVLLGHTDVVRELLKFGAEIAPHDYSTWSYSQVARQQHGLGDNNNTINIIADLLDVFWPEQARALQQHQNYLQQPVTKELPPGAVLKTCSHPVNIEAARCYLVHCSSDQMPTIDAAAITTSEGIPAAFRPLGDLIKIIVDEQTSAKRPSWKFRQASYFYSTKHLPSDIAQECPIGDPRCTVSLNWASACPGKTDNKSDNRYNEDDDVWGCLFGQGEAASNLREPCDCLTKNNRNAFTDRDVSLLLHSAILLEGNRTSPHLSQGPTLPAYSHSSSDDSSSNIKNQHDGVTAISVHVRGGDSCDITNWGANITSWALWPFQWEGVRGSDWNRVQRFCVHPSVHLATLRAILNTHTKVTTVLLATDSPLAVQLFQQEFADRAPHIMLHMNDYDRTPLDHTKHSKRSPSSETPAPFTTTDHWIENRASKDPDFAAHAMHTALEDVRLLARGNLLIAAMCSNFAKMVYAAMVGHNGVEIPVVSLDTCDVICRPDELHFDNGLEFNHEPGVQ